MREILFRGKSLKGEWLHGWYTKATMGAWPLRDCIVPVTDAEGGYRHDEEVLGDTVGQYTGLDDKNGTKIFEGDITRLVMPDGEVRHFEVFIGTVIRDLVVKPLPGYEGTLVPVRITGVFFDWNDDPLLPCVDDNSISDVARMEVIGNIYDNPELLEINHYA